MTGSQCHAAPLLTACCNADGVAAAKALGHASVGSSLSGIAGAAGGLWEGGRRSSGLPPHAALLALPHTGATARMRVMHRLQQASRQRCYMVTGIQRGVWAVWAPIMVMDLTHLAVCGLCPLFTVSMALPSVFLTFTCTVCP